jgi:hypothetical protein
MSQKIPVKNRKSVQSAVVSAIVIAIILTGTFAWYSFTQQALNIFEGFTNPDVNLHDNHEDSDSNKDIFVENSGQRPLYVRVRLSEYMEINGYPMTNGALRTDPALWHVHRPGSTSVCRYDFDWTHGHIHDYYEWVMGGDSDDSDDGWKYFIPAPFSHRALFDKEGVQIREPREVTYYEHPDESNFFNINERAMVPRFGGPDATSLTNWEEIDNGVFVNLETLFDAYARIEGILAETWTAPTSPEFGHDSPAATVGERLEELYETLDNASNTSERRTAQGRIDAFLIYHELGYWDRVYQVSEDVDALGGTPFDATTHLILPEIVFVPIGRTLQTEQVFTMAEWIAAGAPIGNFWIMDSDGWAYWGNILLPGQTTGLLLSEVHLNPHNMPAGTWWYSIHVELEAVTADDLSRFWLDENDDPRALNDSVTEQGHMLLNTISGRYVLDIVSPTEYHTFVNNRDNTYREVIASGVYGPLFVYTGVTPPAPGELFNSTEFAVGSTFTKTIPLDMAPTTFTVLDAGYDIDYLGYGSGVIESPHNGRRYIKLGYGEFTSANAANPALNYGWEHVVWLAAGPTGRFEGLVGGSSNTTNNVLVWTPGDVLPGSSGDRTTEADDSIRARVREVLPAPGGSGSNEYAGHEWVVLGKEGTRTLLITRYAVPYSDLNGAGRTLIGLAFDIDTGDRDTDIGLLTVQEAIDYFANNAARAATDDTDTAMLWLLEGGVVATTGGIFPRDILENPANTYSIRIAAWVDSAKLSEILNP